MWNHRKIFRNECPASERVPIGVARPVQNPAVTTSIESQRALEWLVRQLKWERTLEVLRTEGLAPEPAEDVAA